MNFCTNFKVSKKLKEMGIECDSNMFFDSRGI